MVKERENPNNYNDQNINTGAAAKSGDLMGKKFKEGFFSPEHIKKFSGNVGVKLNENSFASRSENAKVNEVETNVANRNVATSRIANLLGAGGLVEQSTNVKIHDKASNTIKKGSLMTKSKGDEALESVKTTIWSRMARITDVQEREELAKSKISPILQKELSSLQVLDYICGQGDRHRANYFLETGDDKNKQYTHVHGIDNDCSFSTRVDAETVLKEQNQGVYDVAQHHRMVVDASGNLTIPHMDKQLATNILNLKEEEVRFALKDLLEEQFIDYTVQRLRLLQKGIRTELQKEKSEIFIEGGQWNDKTLEDFVQQSYRKKIMSHRKLETSFEKQIFFAQNNFKLDERYEMSKNDNYVATLIVAKNMNISEAEVRRYTNIK